MREGGKRVGGEREVLVLVLVLVLVCGKGEGDPLGGQRMKDDHTLYIPGYA